MRAVPARGELVVEDERALGVAADEHALRRSGSEVPVIWPSVTTRLTGSRRAPAAARAAARWRGGGARCCGRRAGTGVRGRGDGGWWRGGRARPRREMRVP